LYHETGEKKYLNLSKFFVDERGQQPHFFDQETVERGDDPRNFWAKTYRYCQAHVPIREQNTAVGHSVRAAYLWSGVADIAIETGDHSLENSTRSVWNDLTQHQMYVTGGLGPAHTNEGFTFAYDLPNETAYAETCASIALVFWAQRMFHLEPDSRYIDVMERALYNGVISGVSFAGEHFFYANPLSSFPNVNPFDRFSGIVGDQYYQRSEWFDCACCPPNLARMVASAGSYFYSVTPDTIYAHLYNQNRASFEVGGSQVQLEQQTSYPWDGEIQIKLQLDRPASFDLALRIPGWCGDFAVSLNGSTVNVAPRNGYVHINRQWQSGDSVTLSLAMPVERVAPHPEIRQDAGCIALQRGPVVY
ncbi:MAG: glycoside hydrolase family 127 protein, partial [Anaerolineae bacterium]|nr:glycoside hydrolase family 127 protein [Anaerolineae bacterium]